MSANACTEACFHPGRRAQWCARCTREVRPIDALPRGERAADYLVGRILGRGGFAYTYLGYDEYLDTFVAIKEFFPEGLATRDESMGITARTGRASDVFGSSLDSFLAEARRLARIRHPGVVQVLRYKQERGTAYLAMPYYAGDTLQALHDRRMHEGRPWTPGELLALLAPVLDALEHLHAQDPSLLHRDIKPDNVFVEERNGALHPLLIDFGAAREAVGKSRLSRVWTPGFAPYEQQVDVATRQGPHTDVYALAATLYFLLTDTIPEDSSARFFALGEDEGGDPLVPVSQVRADVAAAVGDALVRALEVRVKARTQTIGALRSELAAALRTTPGGDGIDAEAARRLQAEAERRARDEAERSARAEAERRAREDAERRAREEAERKAREAADRERLEREARERRDREQREWETRQREQEERVKAEAAAREFEARRREQEARAKAGAEARRERERAAAAQATGGAAASDQPPAEPQRTRRVDEAPAAPAGRGAAGQGTAAAAPAPAPATPAPAGASKGTLVGVIGGAVAVLAGLGMLYVNGTFSGGDTDAVAVADTPAVAAPLAGAPTAPVAATPSAADSARMRAEEDSLSAALESASAAPVAAATPTAPKPAEATRTARTPGAGKADGAPQAKLDAVTEEIAIGRIDETGGRYMVAAKYYRIAIADAQALVRRYPADPKATSVLAAARERLEAAQRACQAERKTLNNNLQCP